MTPSNVFATRFPINEEWLNGVMMGDKDLSLLLVLGEDTEPSSCAAAGAAASDSIDNDRDDNNPS